MRTQKTIYKLSKNEKNIMEVLWNSNKAMSCAEIIETSPEKNWNPASMFSFMKALLNKNLIEISSFSQSQTSFAREFKAKITKNQHNYLQIETTILDSDLSAINLVEEIISKEKNTDIILELQAMINRKLESLDI